MRTAAVGPQLPPWAHRPALCLIGLREGVPAPHPPHHPENVEQAVCRGQPGCLKRQACVECGVESVQGAGPWRLGAGVLCLRHPTTRPERTPGGPSAPPGQSRSSASISPSEPGLLGLRDPAQLRGGARPPHAEPSPQDPMGVSSVGLSQTHHLLCPPSSSLMGQWEVPGVETPAGPRGSPHSRRLKSQGLSVSPHRGSDVSSPWWLYQHCHLGQEAPACTRTEWN